MKIRRLGGCEDLISYIRVRAVVWECGEGQTNRHTDAVTNIYFTSTTLHATCEAETMVAVILAVNNIIMRELYTQDAAGQVER